MLTDRGPESAEPFRAVTDLGWHPLMRAKKAGKFRPGGWHKGWEVARFAARPGGRWKGRGVAYPTGERLAGTLLACREAGHAGPWLILTDLPPGRACALWSAWRGWVEQGFRDLKGDGWQLSRTRMADPERVARWWAAAALATLWVLEAGQEAQRLEVPATKGHGSGGRGAVASLFALGLAWLAAEPGRGRFRRLPPLAQPPWPAETRRSDRLKEQDWINEHQTIPL